MIGIAAERIYMKDEYTIKVYKDFVNNLYDRRPEDFYKDMISAIIRDYCENNTCSYIKRLGNVSNTITVIEGSILFELKSYYLDGVSYYYCDLPMLPYLYFKGRTIIYHPISVAFDEKELLQVDIKMARDLHQKLSSFSFRRKIKDYVFRSYSDKGSEDQSAKNSERAEAVNDEKREALQAAKDESEKIIREAREEARRIREDAEQEAERIKEEAKLRLQDVTDSAQNSAQTIIRRTIDDYQQQIQDAWHRESEIGMREDERYKTLFEAKREFIDDTTALKRELRDRMKETVDEMRAIQDKLEIEVNKRQASIYHHEFTKIADCFGQLYIIVRKNPFLTDYILSEPNDLSQDTLEDLKKLKSSLNVILRKLESSMASFGMYVYYPNPGDPYDDVLHDLVLSGDADDPYGMLVSECLTPGVMLRGDTKGEDETIIRAVVSLEPKGD